jgi:hypothetical protein
VAAWQVPTGEPLAAPSPGFPPDQGVLSAIDCPWAPDCIAVGSGYGGGRAESWNGFGWYPVSAPAPGPLTGVSCGSHRSCMAVGYSNGRTIADVWRGAGWSSAPPVDPPAARASWLNAISCASASFCMAVGVFTENGYDTFRPLAEVWNGARWALLPPAVSPLWNFGDFEGVSCTSSRWCMAVGVSRTASYRVVALAEGWNGTRWTGVATSFPAIAVTDELTAVSCSSPADCAAVGNYGTRSQIWLPLAELWNGRRWSAMYVAAPTGATFTVLDGVSCAGPYACAAAGYSTDSLLRSTALTELWNGRHWEERPTLGGPSPGALSGVSCALGDECMAVGQNGGPYVEESWNGSAWARVPPAPVAGIAATPDGRGYYLATRDGTVYPAGDAKWYGDVSGRPLGAPVVGITVDPLTGGYWLLGENGGVYAFHAPFYGSPVLSSFRTTAVGLVPVAGGGGYRVATADGGVFDYGPRARFEGSMSFIPLRKPIVAIAGDPATGGYWLIAADGGVFAFHAPFFGSTGAIALRRPIVGAEAIASGQGYRFVAADGGVFSFGAARFAGSLGGGGARSPVVGMAVLGTPAGYVLAEASGRVTGFGGAPQLRAAVGP